MNRRSFFKNLGKVLGVATLLPTTLLSYDPVKQEVVKPRLDNSPLLGYKGDAFLEAGVVYAPYIPLYRTPDIIPNVDAKFAKQFNKAYYATRKISGN